MKRREFSRIIGTGAAGVLAGPLLGQWLSEAQGQVLDRKRFVLFTAGNGFVERNYTCNARSSTDYDLSETFAPLAPHKDDLLILSKFYNPHDRALHGNQWATLSVRGGGNGEELRNVPPGACGISIDRLIAKRVGMSDRFDSTAVGIEESRNKVLCLSLDGPGVPYPAIGSPVRAYARWFGESLGIDESETIRRLAAERSLLDSVARDIEATRQRLVAPERARLDQYLESLRSLERQLGNVTPAANCGQRTAPPASLDRADLDPDVVRAHVDTTFEAQRCGLTRVSHISILGQEGPHNRYAWLGDNRGHHDNYHDGNFGMIRQIDHFILGEIAHYWQRLKDTPEGGGSMADNTIVVYVNCCGGEHHNGQNKHAVLILGSMNGYFQTGRYLDYPEGRHAISDVYVSLANAMGVDIDTFGDESICRGPLPDLT